MSIITRKNTAGQKFTIEQLVLSMFDGVSTELTEEEYKLVGLPRWKIFKRRYFSNLYKTALLYLAMKSIPEAFPNRHKDILNLFNEVYRKAYKDKEWLKKAIEQDFSRFDKLVDFNDTEHRFLKLAIYIVEQIEKRPRKIVYATQLNTRLNDLYNSYIKIGKDITIT